MTDGRRFEAMGDPTRQHIVEVLAAGPISVAEIAARLPVSRPAVSQHLKVLLDAGLVVRRKEAQRNLYWLNHEGFLSIREYIDQLWDTALQRYRNAARQPEGDSNEQ
ncbi:MAG: metalloregulator ArsR/SmtB family transcription factor [Spirochaetia bacterium]